MHIATSAYVDLSAVDTLSDTELADAIGHADIAFARARLNDPRRSSLAYTDAKLAVNVLTAERRRREEKAAVEAAELILIEASAARCPHACRAALSHSSLCECRSCDGRNHGADHRAGRERAIAAYRARVDCAGGVFELLGITDHDEEFARVPADVRRARLGNLDPEDVF